MPKRMFAALDLPERVTETLAGLDPHLPGLRWLPAGQMHLTLCFLAAVPEENERRLIEALVEIAMPPFLLTLEGMDGFGRRGHPSVVWAAVAHPPRELFRLHSRVRAAVKEAGLEVDRKRFHPHVTVGRCKNVSDEELRAFLEAHGKSGFGAFDASGFTLFSSVLHPEGAEHQAVFQRASGLDKMG